MLMGFSSLYGRSAGFQEASENHLYHFRPRHEIAGVAGSCKGLDHSGILSNK